MSTVENQDERGTYRALPEVDEDVLQFILHDEAGPVVQFGQALSDIGLALRRTDQEMEGLSQANPNLAAIVYGTVEGTYSAFANQVDSEQAKALLRAVAHINAFVVLRALDMQWRRTQVP